MPWTYAPPLGIARAELAAAICDAPNPESGYRIYAIGGAGLASSVFATVEAYDTLTQTWSTVAPMLTARASLAAASRPGRLYAIGGYDASINAVATVEIYDPAAGTWASGPSMPT